MSYDHWLNNQAYLSAITVTNISIKSFYLQDGGKNQLAQIWNKIRTSLTLCHEIYSCYQVITAQLDN